MAAILRDEPPELTQFGRQRLAGARPHRAPLPGEGPRAPLPVRQGRRVRALGGLARSRQRAAARVAPSPRREAPPAVRPRGAGDRHPKIAIALVLLAAVPRRPSPAPRRRPGRRRRARAPASARRRPAVREPGRARGRLLRRRHRGRDPRQAHAPSRASRSSRAAARRPTRRRPRRRRRSREELDAHLPPDGDRALAERRPRSNRVQVTPGARRGLGVAGARPRSGSSPSTRR